VAAGVRVARSRTRTGATTTGAVLDYFILFSIGISYSWNAVVHSVFGEFTARVIGWGPEPVPAGGGVREPGLRTGRVPGVPRRRDLLLKLAAVLGVTPFLWGAAGVHIYEIVVHGNYAAGNAGAILWTDLLLPMFGLAAVWAHHRTLARGSAASAPRIATTDPREPNLR
jgi:hypothetical protein